MQMQVDDGDAPVSAVRPGRPDPAAEGNRARGRGGSGMGTCAGGQGGDERDAVIYMPWMDSLRGYSLRNIHVSI